MGRKVLVKKLKNSACSFNTLKIQELRLQRMTLCAYDAPPKNKMKRKLLCECWRTTHNTYSRLRCWLHRHSTRLKLGWLVNHVPLFQVIVQLLTPEECEAL